MRRWMRWGSSRIASGARSAGSAADALSLAGVESDVIALGSERVGHLLTARSVASGDHHGGAQMGHFAGGAQADAAAAAGDQRYLAVK